MDNYERLWNITFDAIPDMVFIQDKDFIITKVNKSLCEALGKKPEEILGRKCYEILHKKDIPWQSCPFEKTRQDLKVHTDEVDDSNVGIPLLVTTSPIFDEKGEFAGSVHIARNISDIKKAIQNSQDELEIQAWGLKKANEGIKILYKELETKNEELRKLDKLKTEFVSVVSHELRTPLSITKEGISLVLDRITGEVNAKQEKVLQTAKNNMDRLARIINSILDISKIESGKMELKREKIDLSRLITNVANDFAPKADAKGIKLILEVPKDEIIINADRDKITQVLFNIINNAVKFTEKGSITVSCVNKNYSAEIIIKDTGMGISKDNMPKLFGKFQQFGRTAGGGEKGTGLGLAIAKSIIELHNGKITAESALDKGTEFYIFLPKFVEREQSE